MTEALVTAVSPILYKSHLMREGGDMRQDFQSCKWSLCPYSMCGPRSTSVLGLRIVQSYVSATCWQVRELAAHEI